LLVSHPNGAPGSLWRETLASGDPNRGLAGREAVTVCPPPHPLTHLAIGLNFPVLVIQRRVDPRLPGQFDAGYLEVGERGPRVGDWGGCGEAVLGR